MVRYKEDPMNCSKMCVCVQSVFCFYCPVGFSSFSVPLPQRLEGEWSGVVEVRVEWCSGGESGVV